MMSFDAEGYIYRQWLENFPKKFRGHDSARAAARVMTKHELREGSASDRYGTFRQDGSFALIYTRASDGKIAAVSISPEVVREITGTVAA